MFANVLYFEPKELQRNEEPRKSQEKTTKYVEKRGREAKSGN